MTMIDVYSWLFGNGDFRNGNLCVADVLSFTGIGWNFVGGISRV